MYAVLQDNVYANLNAQEKPVDQINAVEVVEAVKQDIHVMELDNAFARQQHVQH